MNTTTTNTNQCQPPNCPTGLKQGQGLSLKYSIGQLSIANSKQPPPPFLLNFLTADVDIDMLQIHNFNGTLPPLLLPTINIAIVTPLSVVIADDTSTPNTGKGTLTNSID